MEGYAVSAQCMALVRDNCLIPTKDAPELGYIKESTDKEFVPDVYYKVSTNETNIFYPLSFYWDFFYGFFLHFKHTIINYIRDTILLQFVTHFSFFSL